VNVLLLIAAVVVGTWNGNWFPSGRAEHRAHSSVEAATVEAAAKMLSRGVSLLDPEGTNDVVLCLNEFRNASIASNLVGRIGRKGLKVAAVSAYRRRGNRLDYQQDVIATTLPVARSNWSRWRNAKASTPPRGYVLAALVLEPAVTAKVYNVHLKSNYGGNTEEKRAANREKRRLAVAQLMEMERGGGLPVVIAGDFNADPWRAEFGKETIFSLLGESGFLNHMELLPAGRRGTHPSERWGSSTLDYVFTRGFRSLREPVIVASEGLSDHEAVFVLVDVANSGG
jgi:endonuclease/exonuclease/phosphatase family metal-dependent hydrolase